MLLALVSLLSCQKPVAAPTPVAAPAPVDPVDRTDEMEDHFFHALELQLAVVGGDLEEAHGAATRISGVTQTGTYPEAWQPFLERTRAAADAAAMAPSIREAAQSLARLGTTCAECHTSLGGGPREALAEAPPQDRMALHLYGTHWMGYGLMAPDDAAWLAGARALASGQDLPDAPPLGPAGVLDRIYALAAQAVAASTPDARREVWGELLATCSECHQSLPR